MGAKAEISWKGRTAEGVKREVYARRIGGQWRFFAREKRYDLWQPLEQPPVEEPPLAILDALAKLTLYQMQEKAKDSLARGAAVGAVNQFRAFINEIRALERSGRLDAATASSLIAAVQAIIDAI